MAVAGCIQLPDDMSKLTADIGYFAGRIFISFMYNLLFLLSHVLKMVCYFTLKFAKTKKSKLIQL